MGVFVISSFVNSMEYLASKLYSKFIALTSSIINVFIALVVYIIYDFSINNFQFVQEYYRLRRFLFYLGVDGLSIFFVILTTIITPISLLSN